MKKNILGKVTAFILLLILAACSSTDVRGVWRDENYSGGSLKKVLVVGVFANDLVRRSSEDEFVNRFREKGIEAVASYRIFPLAALAEQQEIKDKVRGQDFDSIIISRVVDKRQVESIESRPVYAVPTGYYRRWDAYYDYSVGYITSPGYATPLIIGSSTDYVKTRDVYQVETNVYTVADENLILSIMSDTYSGLPYEALVRDFVKTVMGQLDKNSMLAR